MTSLSLAFYIIVVLCSFVAPRRYDGYKLLRTVPQTDNDVNSLRVLKDVMECDEVDFWNGVKSTGRPVDIVVSSNMEQTLVALLKDFGLSSVTAVKDIQSLIDDQMESATMHRVAKRDTDSASSEDFDYTNYHTLDEINEWIENIAADYPAIVSKIGVGDSYEGRNIYAIKIGRGSTSGARKPIVWLQAGIHAREWIAPATVIYVAHILVSKYGKNIEITRIIENLDIYIIPVLNVDGYEFTWTNDRLWRKTRSTNVNSECIGADANRNYDWHWGEPGASNYPCNNTYSGSEPNSEIEISHITDFMLNLIKSGEDIQVFIDFHSYSQTWMCPWAYTKELSENFEDQNNLQAEAVAAVLAVNGNNYTHGTISNVMYIASGSSVDWTYGELGITYSYTIELPDTGEFGFVLPRRFIKPVATEIFEGLKVVFNHIL